MKYVVFYMCRTIKILISNWPRKLKFSQFLQAGKTCLLLLTFLTKVTHWSHSTSNLYFDWSRFDRWVHAENLCSILNLVYFDSWSWQSFVLTWDIFNCRFPLNVQSEIQLLSRVFCYLWLVCLLGFWLRNTLLWHRFRFSPCLMGKTVEKSEAILALLDNFQCISNGKPE